MWCFRIDDAKKKKKNDSRPINIKWNNFSLLTGLNGVCWFNIVCGTGYLRSSSITHFYLYATHGIDKQNEINGRIMHASEPTTILCPSLLIDLWAQINEWNFCPFTSSEEKNLLLLFGNVSILFCEIKNGCENGIEQKRVRTKVESIFLYIFSSSNK